MDVNDNVSSSCIDSAHKICKTHIDKLFKIWKVVGYSNLTARAHVVCTNLEQLLNEMVTEETECQNNLITDIEVLLKEAADLSQELGVKHGPIVSGLEDEGIPLLEVKQVLNDRLKDYRAQKQELLHKYEELLQTEHDLQLTIGLKKRPKLTKTPREEDIEEFASYIAQKKEEERELRQQFEETKNKIQFITLELGITPDTSVHKMLASETQICLSRENMWLIKELHQELEQRLENAKSESIELREKLSNLWERLHVDYNERDALQLKYPGYSKITIDGLKAEILKCEEKKRQNIKNFVETIREELADWWDKCCFGKVQRQQFRAFYSDCYNEDLLDLHEVEIEKLKRYFNNNIDILELAKKREKLWKKMMELDERAHDPKRLFANRGGQLLREEKERKGIQKDLPIIDKELGLLLDAYEKEHNAPFLYDGNDLRDIIKSKWDDFQKKKEEEKLARKKGKDQTVMEKSASSIKRKIPPLNTPSTVPNKITKTSAETGPSNTPSCTTRSKVVRRIFDRNGNRENGVNTRTRMPGAQNKRAGSPEMSYTDFQEGLEKRSADQGMIRSSVAPPRLLRERNGQPELSCIKERVATPAKPPRKNSVTRSCTNLSEFRTPQPVRASPGLSRSRSAPRLATTRTRLPIII